MSDFQNQQIFGGTDNSSQLLPGEWNPAGQTPDWGSILATGIGNMVNQAIGQTVGGAVQSGQLQYYGTQQSRSTSLLIVAALIFFVVTD